jgi:hypothetical protein
MVRSIIDSDISYPDLKEIDAIDNGLDASAYDINIKNTDILIALGKLRNNYKDKGIFYVPIYLVVDGDIGDKIGIFEFLSSKYTSLLDEDGDLDIDLIDEPLLFNFVTNSYLKAQYKNHPIESDDTEDEEDEDEDEEEDGEEKSEKEESDSINGNDVAGNDNNDGFSIGKGKTILKELEIEDDDDDIKASLEEAPQDKAEGKKFIGSNGTESSWIENFMKNNNYGIQDNEGGGDCFFAVIRDSFKSIGINITVKQLRETLSESVTEKMFQEYYKMHTQIDGSIEHDKAKLVQMMFDWKKIQKRVKSEKDGKTRLALIAEAKKFKIEFERLKRQKAVSQSMLVEYKWMKGIDSLEKFKSKIKTCNFWADADTIVLLEQLLKIKLIIFSSSNYHDEDMGSVLLCGDMVPKAVEESGTFKPKYYIMAEHTGNHYKLITYKDKKNFRFHELPHGLKKLIKEKCMEGGKNIFNYIPKFGSKGKLKTTNNNVTGKELGSMENNLTSPSTKTTGVKPKYDEKTIFQFYSKSATAPLPGKGSGETIAPERIKEFSDLAAMKGWRRVLSNFFISPFELDGHKWNSVEHFYHAQKFKKNNPEFSLQFSLDSNSDISKEAVLAKSAGGKTGKSKGKLLRPKNIIMDDDFFSGGRNIVEMERGQMAKYTQGPKARAVLKATKNAKLQHYLRGQKPIVFEDTMRIRERIR